LPFATGLNEKTPMRIWPVAGGTAASGGPSVTPPTTAYLTEHASTSNVTPFSDPALTVVSFRPRP